jgi:hypothetical protein
MKPAIEPHILAGCTITDIHSGVGLRGKTVYGKLREPNGDVLISATLEYITKRILEVGVAHK